MTQPVAVALAASVSTNLFPRKGTNMTKTTKNELDRITSRSQPSGNSAFAIDPAAMTTNAHRQRLNEKKRDQDADRKAKASKSAKGRERLERQKELGDDAPMTVDQLETAIEDIRDSFGIVLTPYNLSWMANQQQSVGP